MEQKYYWVLLQTMPPDIIGGVPHSRVTDAHPFTFLRLFRRELARKGIEYVIELTNYKEISKEEYNLWNQ